MGHKIKSILLMYNSYPKCVYSTNSVIRSCNNACTGSNIYYICPTHTPLLPPHSSTPPTPLHPSHHTPLPLPPHHFSRTPPLFPLTSLLSTHLTPPTILHPSDHTPHPSHHTLLPIPHPFYHTPMHLSHTPPPSHHTPPSVQALNNATFTQHSTRSLTCNLAIFHL